MRMNFHLGMIKYRSQTPHAQKLWLFQRKEISRREKVLENKVCSSWFLQLQGLGTQQLACLLRCICVASGAGTHVTIAAT